MKTSARRRGNSPTALRRASPARSLRPGRLGAIYCYWMKFAPEYVTNVLNENFEDAKELLLVAVDGDQLRPPGDAGRAGHHFSRRRARAARRARRHLARQRPRGALRRHLRRPVLLHRAPDQAGVRRRCRRPPAHGAQPQRHRHDDVPDAAAGVHRRRWRRDAGPARGAAVAGRSAQGHRLRRAHAHAAGAAVDDRALPAGGDRAARARHHAARPPHTNRPIAIRSAPARSPAPAFRSIATARASCWDSAGRPATPTAASPPSTTCSRACRQRAC